jgi:SAM-dependent methyltransferase
MRDPITSNLYDAAQVTGLPEDAVLASLGAQSDRAGGLRPGNGPRPGLWRRHRCAVVRPPRRPTGKAYGLDMTDEMLALARENQRKAGLSNVEFLKGKIEHIPLADNSVDVVISNCVINLSADKDQVMREAFRVLKPGGRFAVSDVVTRGDVPAEVRRNMLLWVGCVAGALRDSEYADKLAGAGFEQVEIEPTRIYKVDDARTFLSGHGIDVDAVASQMENTFMSAFVRAVKPPACCAPGCCA